MAVEFRICRQWGFVLVTLQGQVSPAEHVQSFVDYSRHPEFSPDQNVLMNLRDFAFDALFFEQLVEVAAKLEPLYKARSGKIKTAIYAPGDAAYGMTRVYQSITEGRTDQTNAVFREVVPALEFIGLEPGSPAWDWALGQMQGDAR